MKVTCPACRAPISAEQINVAGNLAVCTACDEAFSLSSLLNPEPKLDDFRVDDPPPGAWFEETFDGWRLGATTRSPAAFFLVPFMCVWSGGSLGGIYGGQIAAGEFQPFLSLFGLPFLAGTVAMGAIAVMCVCGRVVVSVERDVGNVFTGVGRIGWTRPFDWGAVVTVEETLQSQNRKSTRRLITLIGNSRLSFGSMLNDARRFYMVQSLRKLAAARRRA